MDGRIDLITLLSLIVLASAGWWLIHRRRNNRIQNIATPKNRSTAVQAGRSSEYTVFISYARPDEKLARQLANDLAARGYSVWWDINLVGSDEFRNVIQERLRAAKAVIVIWSKLSAASRFVRQEAEEALHFNKLISTRVRGMEIMEIPIGFREQHTDLVDDRARIALAVERLLGADTSLRRGGQPSADSLSTFQLYKLINPNSILGFPFIGIDNASNMCIQLSDSLFSLGELTEEENSYVLTDYSKIKEKLSFDAAGIASFSDFYYRAKFLGLTAHFTKNDEVEDLTLTLGEERVFEIRYSCKGGVTKRYDHNLSVDELGEISPLFNRVRSVWKASSFLRAE